MTAQRLLILAHQSASGLLDLLLDLRGRTLQVFQDGFRRTEAFAAGFGLPWATARGSTFYHNDCIVAES
jgi:hypothetical protein